MGLRYVAFSVQNRILCINKIFFNVSKASETIDNTITQAVCY